MSITPSIMFEMNGIVKSFKTIKVISGKKIENKKIELKYLSIAIKKR